ncbi:bifunctional diaminohydroxyphosphoribosylaminopyrimidine deaminase/5-amino-6-(5-phosphoribosylamino)uracil reductase RibD [Cobetia crustatorum]|uniref:Riboflavin biosynthesis protein RibD n=1 Tax=Cobetia crustatorum TaxID=553385 RepID=A0A558HJ29_9GAMM|nr:bifunctional diaminohydroxyphosphoribosylaminopyrimidine deaminase/5-amino-6-(5-phosphoribosylamino)uracil reductase RibD [Cobetia crustatorum]TVU69144.1 bifunctional diaminohydroxyphosphoribosylaminopyrimidine deaminase/5-amino-6-(5-phosphoribosylamino)uracil reductase RibD [Cobetia crustatorum]
MSIESRDIAHMSHALRLARLGSYTTHPNPRVGCVLVDSDTDSVIATGFHARAGEGHAEVNALAAAGERALGSVAYVTLEPCSHTGRTGPCAKALIAAGVSRVVIAMRDPNPQVAGRGIALLEGGGIAVTVGVLETEARALNPGFLSRMERGRPFVRLKQAMSLDGRTAMASGESQWITGPEARSAVQRLRARSSVVMSGIESVIFDDSRLSVRADQLSLEDHPLGIEALVAHQPLRVVVDSRLRLPLAARILEQTGRTLLVCVADETPALQERRTLLEAAGAEVLALPAGQDGRVDLPALMAYLAEHEQANEVLLETGAVLAGAMLSAGLIDEMQLFMAPTLLGGDARPLLALPGLDNMANQRRLEIREIRAIGRDWRITAIPVASSSAEMADETLDSMREQSADQLKIGDMINE